MSRTYAMVWLAVGVLWSACAFAQADGVDWHARIAASNADWTRAAAAGDTATLSRRYADDATLMPEHAQLRRGRQAVADFHRQWWAMAQPTRWERNSDHVEDVGAHLIEMGHYAQTLVRSGEPAFDYRGKYLVIWRKANDGPQVVAELWGADAPFERSRLPEIPPAASTPAAIDAASPEVKRALAERNAVITTLVRERRGAEHAQLFREDAAYLTYYTPPLMGIAPIRAYFIEHERPGPVSIDSIDIRSEGVRALDAGDLQLEEGSYRVAWRADGDSGVVQGKSLNLWKRDEQGGWRLYRQAVNHD